MKLIELKSNLIDYARTLIPEKYKAFIRVTGTEGQDYMRIQSTEKKEVLELLKNVFHQDKIVTHISKNADISGLEEIQSFNFPTENNQKDLSEFLPIDFNLDKFIEEEKERIKRNFFLAIKSPKASINKLVKYIDNIEYNKMDYFDFSVLKKYSSSFDNTYDSTSKATAWYKATIEKLKFLVGLLSDELNEKFEINYKERPNGQGGRSIIVLKDYVLIGFAPAGKSLDGNAFIKLHIHHLSTTPIFGIEIDLNWKIENNPFKSFGADLRDSSRFQYLIDESFPGNWADLISKIKNDVANTLDLFNASFFNIKNVRKYIIANVSWNSKNWTEPTDDESGHRYVKKGGIPHECYNFDFDNPRNTRDKIFGFAQFTHAPNVDGNNNLVIFYSRNKIVGFYGKCEIKKEHVVINDDESYNLIGERDFCIALDNHIDDVLENGYMEGKERVGMIGFNYLESLQNINSIIDKAIELNLSKKEPLLKLKKWVNSDGTSENYWIFQANPDKGYRIFDALKDNILNTWMIKQYKGEIKNGDKVILRVGGENPGVYALASVISDVNQFIDISPDADYYSDPEENKLCDRVQLKLDYNLIDSPVTKYKMNELGLDGGRQGTNFRATQAQYEKILSIIKSQNMSEPNKLPLNQIFFGPPGTGKTYHTIDEAVKIINPDFYEKNKDKRDILRNEFKDKLIVDWESPKGQIGFCTFHQSFSYEDFVEGIKPVKPEVEDTYLKYIVQEGIFKKICRLADDNIKSLTRQTGQLFSFTEQQFTNAVFYKISLGDINDPIDQDIYDYCILNKCISIGFGRSIDFTGKDETSVVKVFAENKLDSFGAQAMNIFKNYLKVGNYIVVSKGNNYIRALGKVTGEYKFDPSSPIPHKQFRSVEWIFKDQDIPVQEFYEKNLMQQTIYKLKSDWIKKEFFVRKSDEAPTLKKGDPQKYVLVIDEINRGNVASIFGELITLIEKDKRAGNDESLEVVLPYSKDRFTVPPNLYIIGTLNTADRSIEALDTALRRRFSFREMPPVSTLIAEEGKLKSTNGKIGNIDVVNLLDTINERIEKLIDKDHKIGHSYFMKIYNKEGLIRAFKNKVIPLLEEYFFGDFGKIGLVLGDSFVEKVESEKFQFAAFSGYDNQVKQDLIDRPVYKIKPPSSWVFEQIFLTSKPEK